MENKRGQGLSTNAIILIILGIVILVVLVVGFAMGWDKLAPWLSKENVGEIATGCNVACNTGGEYAFCSQARKLIDVEGNEIETTCLIFAAAPVLSHYGIDKCNIDCSKEPCENIEITVSGNLYNGTIRESCPSNEYIDVSVNANNLATNKACCITKPILK